MLMFFYGAFFFFYLFITGISVGLKVALFHSGMRIQKNGQKERIGIERILTQVVPIGVFWLVLLYTVCYFQILGLDHNQPPRIQIEFEGYFLLIILAFTFIEAFFLWLVAREYHWSELLSGTIAASFASILNYIVLYRLIWFP
jgi:hypothetical protein